MNDAPHPTDVETIQLASQRWFFVGGEYHDTDAGVQLGGAMYVEQYTPLNVRQPYPIVMIHGGVQTGCNFTATPDGRRGWLHDFLRAGFEVYIVDQPERGRSGHTFHDDAPQRLMRYDVSHIESRFTAPARHMLWAQAARHTQWPGSGVRGDECFDRFFASQVEMLADRDEIERINQLAGAALLDEIGPAVLLTHSQSGPFGWLIADARPHLVRGIVALEPNGPPFREVQFSGAEEPLHYGDETARPYGITRMPLTYDPPPTNGSGLGMHELGESDDPTLIASYLQAEPARQLVNLRDIPIVIYTADASYHATYDHCTSDFLHQAGVKHDFVRLAHRGLHGNGHMVMLELNNHQAADEMIDWISANIDAQS